MIMFYSDVDLVVGDPELLQGFRGRLDALQRLEAVPAERQNSETLESLEVGDAGILKSAFPAACIALRTSNCARVWKRPGIDLNCLKMKKRSNPELLGESQLS